MKKLTVLCDVDGVIADFIAAYTRCVKKLFPYLALPKTIKTWDLKREELDAAVFAKHNKGGTDAH